MSDRQHIREELLIDFALGNVAEPLQRKIKEHVHKCERCERKLNEWLEIVSDPTGAQPSSDLKEKVWKSIEISKQPIKKKRTRGFYVALSSAAAMLLILIGSLMNYHSNLNGYEVATNDNSKGRLILNHPQTQQVSLIPVADYKDINGNLWINNDSQELLLEVNGLAQITNRDYQLWIIYDNDEIKGEILSTIDGYSRVWIKGTDVNQFKFIKASVEPRGGSIKPTGPETFFIPIK